MRNVEAHLLQEKIDEAVSHYMSTHQSGEPPAHLDSHSMSLNVQDESGRVVTVMQGQSYSSHMNRQVSVGEAVEAGAWSEEMMDPERLAALVAHLAHQSRTAHHQPHHKVPSVRDVDSSVILDTPMRLFNGQALDSQQDSIVVQVPPLPPLQDMKRCDGDWFHDKEKGSLKDETEVLRSSEQAMLDVNAGAGASPAQKAHNKKSLPHKKRISRKLKRNNTPQQDIVVINCTDEVSHEEILPDSFVPGVPHVPDAHHITHQVRPILICQICGEFYGEEQLKFYQHLKQHYEPHATIIIENPVTELAMDKMTNTCIVDNGAALPDSIVELSLETTVPKTIYQSVDKHILYTSSDKTLYTNKVQYSTASMDKVPTVPTSEAEKVDLYDSLEKLEIFGCVKCNKTFRKQKQCEAHIKEHHASKMEDMGEFSEPEDLMEGIHVCVEEVADSHYEHTLLPHLTVDNGHVTQEHTRHWYMRGNEGEEVEPAETAVPEEYCTVCPAPPPAPARHNKELVLERILVSEEPNNQNISINITPEEPKLPPEPEPEPQPSPEDSKDDKNKKTKKCVCPQCGRVFFHRNSLLYHILSHKGKQHECEECGKEFYTTNALKVHKRLHNGDKPYKCDECGREFRQWSDLKYHKVSLHSTQKHFKCEYCGKEFARKYSLNVHRRIHTGEKNYKCNYCTKTFRASSYRLAHMRTHTGDRPYKCTICEKGFRVAGDLRRHMLTHEKIRNRQDGSGKNKQEQQQNKDEKIKQEVDIKIEIQPEEADAPKMKKIAVASTAKPILLKNSEKKPKATKKAPVKKVAGGAPNVTVATRNGEHFKMMNNEYPNNVEVFDTRQDYNKFKEVYTEPNVKPYNEQIINYKDNEQERELALLRPMFSNNMEEVVVIKPAYTRAENTDGKMQVYTHVEKRGLIQNNLNLEDVRHLERDRNNLHGEGIEHGFLENLTALYNIPAV